MRSELSFTCSDRGTHGSAEVMKVRWTPRDAIEGEVYELDDARNEIPVAVGAGVRETRAGRNRQQNRTDVQVTTRADGGLTFHPPECPRCRKTWPALRDDSLEKLRRWPGVAVDLSQRQPLELFLSRR